MSANVDGTRFRITMTSKTKQLVNSLHVTTSLFQGVHLSTDSPIHHVIRVIASAVASTAGALWDAGELGFPRGLLPGAHGQRILQPLAPWQTGVGANRPARGLNGDERSDGTA